MGSLPDACDGNERGYYGCPVNVEKNFTDTTYNWPTYYSREVQCYINADLAIR